METDVSSLSDTTIELLRAARSVAPNAYNPYSKFHVGAAIRADSGEIFCGTFFEVASYPEGVCAERVAIGCAITSGFRAFTEIAIVGGKITEEPQKVVTPCGGCRQAIVEMNGMSPNGISVVCSDYGLNSAIVMPASALMPFSFG